MGSCWDAMFRLPGDSSDCTRDRRPKLDTAEGCVKDLQQYTRSRYGVVHFSVRWGILACCETRVFRQAYRLRWRIERSVYSLTKHLYSTHQRRGANLSQWAESRHGRKSKTGTPTGARF